MGKSRIKTKLTTTAKIVIPAAIIGYLLWRIDPADRQRFWEQPKNYVLLSAALGVGMAAISLTFIRWCLLVRCQGIKISMVEGIRLGAICFLLTFVSAGSVGGDLFKAIFLARRSPGKRIEAVASVVVDRGVGFYGLMIVVVVALLIAPATRDVDSAFDIQTLRYLSSSLLILGTVVLTFLVLGGKIVDRMILLGSRLPWIGFIVAKVGPPLRMFHRHPFVFCLSVLMSVAVHLMLVVSIYLVARGLYRDPPTFSEHMVIVPFAFTAAALPIAPAGVGVLEWAVDELYRVVPATETLASGTLVALVFELVRVIIAILGTVFFWTAGKEVRASLHAAESGEDAVSSLSVPG